MIECKEFYLNNDDSWTIVYKNGINYVVETLPIDFDYIGNTVTHDSLSGVTYRYFPILSCQWDFTRDGKLCPILKNEKWGFVNSLFEIVIEPQFDYVGEDIEGEQLSCWRPPLSIHKTQWLNGNCCVVLNGKTTVVDEKDFISSEKCVIEQNTNYAYKLKYMDNPTSDKVRNLSTKFYRELPLALQDELFEALNRGIDILDSEPQMTAYLFAFGKMHQAKLNYAFDKLPKEFLEQPEINIIDYGCGLALGTMCYADFLRENSYTQKVKTITLIEPSEICLKRAALHASMFFPEVEIKTVNKKFDNLTEDDIVCSEDTPTLHILSNVLDILRFNLERFTDLVKGCLTGYNQFVCVGPYFNYSDKDDRINDFCRLLDGNAIYSKVFDKYEFEKSKTWTAHFLCFDVGELSEVFSTEATDEDIENGIHDEYGGIYSRDGKKLLSYFLNGSWETYVIKEGTQVICDKAFCNFEGCNSLKQIIIPDSVTSIGSNPFYGCKNPIIKSKSTRFLVTNEGLLIDTQCNNLISYVGKDNNVTIPDSIMSIGNHAFDGCISLQQITIPNSVMSIGDAAFAGCLSLHQIAIPNSVVSIGKDVFGCCDSLQQITIPFSVTSIGSNPFYGCEDLIIESESTRFFVTKEGLLIDTQYNNIISYIGKDNSVTIPDSVTSIGDSAFLHCFYLRQITMPDSVMSIGNYAFSFCLSLQQIIIPKVSVEKFKQLLPTELWDKLYYLEKADVNAEDMDNDLPF